MWTGILIEGMSQSFGGMFWEATRIYAETTNNYKGGAATSFNGSKSQGNQKEVQLNI